MTRTLLASALLAALAPAMPALAATGHLTVYSGDFEAVSQSEAQPGGPGFALMEKQVDFELKAGVNDVSLGGLPRALDPGSVVLDPPAGVRIAGQRFDFALDAQQDLMRRALGQVVTVEQSVGDQRQSHTGTLVSVGEGLALRLADGRIRMLSEYSSFDLPPMAGAVAHEPTLHWTLVADRAGRHAFGLDYATAGLAWRAEYSAQLQGQGRQCRMSLDGAAMVVNRSGADFRDVGLTLVAGEPNRGSHPQPEMAMARGVSSDMKAYAGAPTAQASGEYQSYTLPTPGSLPQGSVQRLPLLDPASGIACERRYETSGQMGDWRPPQPITDVNFGAGDRQQQPVLATLRFDNAKAQGLGLPMPAGRVRMFEGGDFLGEASLGHTAAGNDVALTIGTVFDLSAERTREDFQLDAAARTMTERVSVLVRNAKSVAATVRVNERLGRWTDWEIVSSSVPFEKRGAQSVAFDVPVPAAGETRLDYTVRYRWAADVRIP